ncbi:alpha/beta hydrolase [Nocardioides solisilvae]|uniref:alpha/beta hydrolase n=1 Tax=Nocardioides solisilvae TaxID=1542435 RepID=UPI000D74F251|nr:alpha/beta hydrolase [Nocardioides solisilvae]
MTETDTELAGHAGTLFVRRWTGERTRYVVLLVHGYGEHTGRYPHVAERLVADGAAVLAPDHVGHGRSDGERVLVEDLERVCDDLHRVEELARAEHPGLPVVLLGHSMGGLVAARYAQRYGDGLAAVVLSAPVLGRWEAVEQLLAAEEIPDVPIDPATLSRDPAVGEAYAADELVWHGPFKRPTLEALRAATERVGAEGAVDVPILWLHGEDDRLVPIGPSREGFATLGGRRAEQRTYPGARHEILNETNRDEVLDDVLAFVGRHLP